MKFLIIYILTIISFLSFGQNRHFNVGHNNNGLVFGNSKNINGIRINLIDKDVNNVNGINISGNSRAKITNGISIGLVASKGSTCNGLVINGLVADIKKANGIVISGLGTVVNKINGFGFGGLALAGDSLNGLFVSPLGITWWNTEQIKKINGVTAGFIFGANAEHMNGLSIGLIFNDIEKHNGVMIAAFNSSKELHGFQFGLLNYAGNNRKLFRWIPIMNFNLRKKASR